MTDGYAIRVNKPPTQERLEEVARKLWSILAQNDGVTYTDLILETGFTRTEIDAAFIHIVLVFIASRGAKRRDQEEV